MLGTLTPLDIPVSGFRLHPVVGDGDTRPALRPSDGEVARILEVAVDDLLAPGAVVWRSAERDGAVASTFRRSRRRRVEIWGATAMVLAEFLALLGWTGPAAVITKSCVIMHN